ncbi:hypothetical protein YC2023_077448 [Brassica napus]
MAVSRRRCKLPLILPSSSRLVSASGSKDFLIFGSRRRQPTRVFRVSICQWGLWSLGGLFCDSGISQRREQDEFMVVSSHIVFAGIGMLLESTSSGRWSGGIGVLRGYGAVFKGYGDHRELATPEATWEFPASMAMRRTSRYHGHCVR